MLLRILILWAFFWTSCFSIKTVLTSPYAPFAVCDLDNRATTTFSGFELEFFEHAMSAANFTRGVDYEFKCAGWLEMFDIIENSNDPDILGAVAGITIKKSRIKKGLKFSQPTIKTGLSLMYKHQSQTSFFLRSLSFTLIAIFIISAIVVGILLYFLESTPVNVINYIHHALVLFFKIIDFKSLTVASRVLQIFWMYILMILVMLYLAATTIALFNDQNHGGITSLDDIIGLTVLATSIYKEQIQSVGAKFGNFVFGSPDYEESMKAIQAGEGTYWGGDGLWVSYIHEIECGLHKVLTNFVEFDYGLMMPNITTIEDEQLVNTAITAATTEKSQSQRWSEYVASNTQTRCLNKPLLKKAYISLDEVGGLWEMWLVWLLVCFVIFLYGHVKRHIYQATSRYHFHGLRGRADAKLQRRVAGVCAVTAAASISVVHYKTTRLAEVYIKRASELLTRPRVLNQLKIALTTNPEIVAFLAGPIYSPEKSPRRSPRKSFFSPNLKKRKDELSKDYTISKDNSKINFIKKSADNGAISIDSPMEILVPARSLSNTARMIRKSTLQEVKVSNDVAKKPDKLSRLFRVAKKPQKTSKINKNTRNHPPSIIHWME